MAARKKSSGLNRRSGTKVLLMVLPYLCLVFLFSYLPLWGWAFSFFNYKPGRPLLSCEFVGFYHYTRLFTNEILRMQLLNSIVNTLGIVGIGWIFAPLPMIFAIFLSEMRSKVFKRTVQTLTTLPHFISWAIVYSLMFGMLNVNTGVVNKILVRIGLLAEPVNFLASPNHIWFKMYMLSAWKGLGWSAIIYIAAIAGIDQTLYEAAYVDGVNRWQKIWYITVPGLLPTFFVIFIISIGSFLSTGMEQYLIFQNSMNKDSIQVLDLYVYNIGISKGQISYGTAVGVMKSVISVFMFSGANSLSKVIRGESVF